MKRLFFTIILITLGLNLFAQNLNSIFNKYAKYEDADKVEINGLLFALAKPFMASDDEDMEVIKKLNPKGLGVLDLSECNKNVKSDFKKDMESILNNNSFTTLMRVRDDDDDVSILVNERNNKVTDIIFYITGDDCTLVRFQIDAKRSDVQKVIEQTVNDNN